MSQANLSVHLNSFLSTIKSCILFVRDLKLPLLDFLWGQSLCFQKGGRDVSPAGNQISLNLCCNMLHPASLALHGQEHKCLNRAQANIANTQSIFADLRSLTSRTLEKVKPVITHWSYGITVVSEKISLQPLASLSVASAEMAQILVTVRCSS